MTNPFLAEVDRLSIALVAAEKEEQGTRDEWFLAIDARAKLNPGGKLLHTSAGAFPVRADGSSISGNLWFRANSRIEKALEAYQYASQLATQARGKLYDAQKASETWEIRGQYDREQAAAEAALTPAQRELRARQEMAQQIMASR